MIKEFVDYYFILYDIKIMSLLENFNLDFKT